MSSVEWNASSVLPRPIDGSGVKFERYTAYLQPFEESLIHASALIWGSQVSTILRPHQMPCTATTLNTSDTLYTLDN